MLKILLCCYVALMPFLHGLSPFPIIALNSLILMAVAPFVMASSVPRSYQFSSGNFFALAILLYGTLAWLWSPLEVQQDRWQAALQWAFSTLALFILVRRWIIVSQIKFEIISKICFFSAIFLGISSVAEFILVNSTGLFFSNLIYFSVDTFTDANIFSSSIMRPRVFSAEAGFTSMIFELLIPMGIVHFLNCGLALRTLFVASCLFGLIVLFSMASILSMTIAIFIFNVLKKNSAPMKFAVAAFAAGYIVVVMSGIELSNLPFYKVTEFFDQSNYSQSEGSRQETLAAGAKLIRENPLGIGWGTVLQESKIPGTDIDRMIFGSGLISLWLELAVAIGFVGFLFPAYYVCRALSQISKVQGLPASCCFVSLCSLTVHHFAVFEVWFPMFWFALALSQVLVVQGGQHKKRSIR
jgi:hypothetical protein